MKDFRSIFRKMVWKKVIQDKRTYVAIANCADVSKTVVHQLVYNKPISLDNLEKIGKVYGYRLAVITDAPDNMESEAEGKPKKGVDNSFKGWK